VWLSTDGPRCLRGSRGPKSRCPAGVSATTGQPRFGVPAHITVTGPFLRPSEATVEARRRLVEVLRRTTPFSFRSISPTTTTGRTHGWSTAHHAGSRPPGSITKTSQSQQADPTTTGAPVHWVVKMTLSDRDVPAHGLVSAASLCDGSCASRAVGRAKPSRRSGPVRRASSGASCSANEVLNASRGGRFPPLDPGFGSAGSRSRPPDGDVLEARGGHRGARFTTEWRGDPNNNGVDTCRGRRGFMVRVAGGRACTVLRCG
jgi:hypothetical protein